MPLPLWLNVTVELSLIRKENMMNGFVGTFSPLIFSSATVIFKRITTLISEKRDHPYTVMYSIGLGASCVTHYFTLQ